MISSDNSYFIGGQQVQIDDAIAAVESFASEQPDGAVFLQASPEASSGALIELRGSLYSALPNVPVNLTLAAPSDSMVQPEWDALDRVGADTCGMRVVRGFLGKPAADIPAERLPEIFRILAPTDQATMDYIQARLNVLTDEDGMVIGFKCG
ncbi:MAG: I78 family peptidase inhibitor [Pseudomonadota bacterium]